MNDEELSNIKKFNEDIIKKNSNEREKKLATRRTIRNRKKKLQKKRKQQQNQQFNSDINTNTNNQHPFNPNSTEVSNCNKEIDEILTVKLHIFYTSTKFKTEKKIYQLEQENYKKKDHIPLTYSDFTSSEDQSSETDTDSDTYSDYSNIPIFY